MEKEKLNAIVTKARTGDPDAINELINASYQDIYYYALKIVKDDQLAADATQDSCIEIIQTIPNLKESAAFVTWCRRIVYHQCTKRIGKSRIVPLDENEDGETILDRIPDEAPKSIPDEIVENREFRKLMLDMIDALPEAQRSALLLYYYERLSVKQIAEIQNENENTVKSRLFQGRKAVKKQVEDYEAKTGTKLYSLGTLPLLYFLFHTGRAEANAAAATLAPKLQAAVTPAIATVSGTAGAGVAATAAGTSIASSIAVKIAAGVLAVAVAAGAVAAGSHLLGDSPEETDSSAESSESTVSDDEEEHIHSYTSWAFDEENHWQICDCGAFSEESKHTYADGECTACRMIQPLPSGNTLLTYDCASLTGHWINIVNDYEDQLITEFYISGDGSLSIQGTTYYPIGNIVGGTDPDGNDAVDIYFRDTPYDPAVGITEEEMFQSTVIASLQKTGDYLSISLLITDPETHNLTFHSEFYRESDYFGYEKVALTPENFSEYFEVTFRPIEFFYTSHNAGFMATQYMDLTLREGLGYPSWCQVQGELQSAYNTVAYHVQTQTYEIPDPNHILVSDPLSIDFFGYKEAVRVVYTNGSNFPSNGIIEWFGKLPEDFTVTTVVGYVFVPIQ